MKNYNVLNNIDKYGRIFIPEEYRKFLGWKSGDSLFVFVEKEQLVIKKFAHICEICKEPFNINVAKAKICDECVSEIIKFNQKFIF